MSEKSKPLLHSGFQVADGLSIGYRLETVFFTEVYTLSNGHFLYVFPQGVQSQTIASPGGTQTFKLVLPQGEFTAAKVERYSREMLANILASFSDTHGFNSVAGMRELKALLVNEVIEPLRHPEKFRKFRLSIPNGILLYGPPGCGKTFIVRKLAEELSYKFIELGPSAVATPWVHGAVGNIAKVFETAKREGPAVIFIDEIEGLIPKREDLGSHADIKKEEINEFLMQLNNASDRGILVVGATNRPQMIDTAILRSGRMDKRILVPPPDFSARREMFQICLSGRPYDSAIDFDKLATLTENFVGSDIELIVTDAARAAVARDSGRIEQEMILEVISRFSPSISTEEIEKFRQLSYLERW
jgi:transitional endoplasmic reticulum ATPase